MKDYDARKHGKKVAVYLSEGAPGRKMQVDIRLDGEGKFHAHFNEAWYTAPTMAELHQQVDAAVAAQGEVKWEYLIEIDEVDYGKDEARTVPRTFALEQIRLICNYKVIRRSQKITPVAGEALRRWEDGTAPYRLIDEVTVKVDGELVPCNEPRRERDGYRDRHRWVPYTRERWRALEQITEATQALGARLAAVLNGKPAAVATFLDDTAGVARLLPPADPKP